MATQYVPVRSLVEIVTLPYYVTEPFESIGSTLGYNAETDAVTIWQDDPHPEHVMYYRVGMDQWQSLAGRRSKTLEIDLSAVSLTFKRGMFAPPLTCRIEAVGRPGQLVVHNQPIATGAGSQGPKGDQGDIGPIGPAGGIGPAGPQGATGAAGSPGQVGSQGPQGLIGPQGDPGPAGAQGEIGPQGIQGVTGSQGPAGGGLRVSLASDVINNNAVANTIADVTGLSFPVVAGTRYKFRFFITYTSAATTTGSRWAINGPAITDAAYRSEYTLSATARTFNEGLATYNVPAACNASSIVATNVAVIEGVIRCSAPGSVIARFASEIAASAITARAGRSFVEYEAIA